MTLLTLSMPWATVIIIFPLCLSLFSFMRSLVRLSLMILDDDQEWFAVFFAPASTGFIWLYATAATGMMLSPVPLLERLMSLLFCLFLFRLTLTDAFTGFLPRELTIRCLIAGLVSALIAPGFIGHFLTATTALVIFGVWRYVTFRIHARECLGLGDVWLAGAIAAWLGGREGLNALLIGVVLFVLLQISVRRITEGGPMGPWLCAGAISVTLFKLYQPLITW